MLDKIILIKDSINKDKVIREYWDDDLSRRKKLTYSEKEKFNN
jgi:hypothetical protein